jgi:hypothetical protein
MIASNRGKRLPIQALRVFDGRLVSAAAIYRQVNFTAARQSISTGKDNASNGT